MGRINRDVIIAVVLVAFTAVFYGATYAIRKTTYGTVGSDVWPRAILIGLGVLCILYLINAWRDRHETQAASGGAGLIGWFATYRNALLCFVTYALFLATVDYLGMLIGGILFVFVLLNLLGGWSPRRLAIHGAIAVSTIGAMWAVFTFGLRVILPEGEILRIW
jgi:hypothetical protein